MRAAVVHEFGRVPAIGEFPEPEPGDGELVVDVAFAGLNPVDRLRLAGYDYLNVSVPYVAGRAGVGLVGGCRRYFSVALVPSWSFATPAPVAADELLDVPDGLSDEMTVPIGIAGLSGWLPLTYDTQLSGGERVLVTGATGVAAKAAPQAARLLDACSVVAAGRHVETLESLLDRGADEIAVLGDDPHAEIGAAAGDGFDVVVDCVFGEPFAAALGCTAPGGR